MTHDRSKCFLNVGGGSKAIPVPAYLAGYRHDLLDIDPAGAPDICLDARQLHTLPGGTYDVIYCSHNLEHYHRHHAVEVLRGFYHVLKPDGFVQVNVPNMNAVMQHVVKCGLDIDDVLYENDSTKILVRDVIYGWSRQIEQSGQDFYAHKTGFTPKSLTAVLKSCGFSEVAAFVAEPVDLMCFGFKRTSTPEQRKLLGFP